MASLIPSMGSCTFDSGGERRFAERLEAKLEDDYLCWYNVPVGPSTRHPDFIVLHPRRGLLVLYDDAQSVYGDAKRKKFSFKRVGIQAQGRTTILKLNYRNTDDILRFARDVARASSRRWNFRWSPWRAWSSWRKAKSARPRKRSCSMWR